MDPIFSAEQMSAYRETGYVVAPEFFTARETQALVAELHRFQREGLLRNVTTKGDGTTHDDTRLNLQVIPIHDKSPLFRALPFHPKVVAAITQLIGAPAIIHLDQIFLKPAQHGTGTSWHQDNAYFKIADPMMGVGMWTALHDATVANGTMEVVPGAWREPLEHTRDPSSDHHVRCYPDESKALPIEIPAGGALFFCYGLPHCTRGNTTEKDRAGLAMHFLREDHAPAELVEPGRKERPLINGPRCTGGEEEYGERVADRVETEIERVLASAV